MSQEVGDALSHPYLHKHISVVITSQFQQDKKELESKIEKQNSSYYENKIAHITKAK